MKDHMNWLGYKVKDRITGYVGVVTSVSFDLYGCKQAFVDAGYSDKDERRGQWFDANRLEMTEPMRVMEPPFDITPPVRAVGPADKPMP